MAFISNKNNHTVSSLGIQDPVYLRTPYMKYMFFVRININPNSGLEDSFINRLALGMIVKNVTVGGINFDTEEINQYNRTRLTYNRPTYQDTNVVMHDTADGRITRFLNRYYEYFFQEGRPGTPDFGYDTRNIADESKKYAIDSIDIFQFQFQLAKQTTLWFPRLTSFQGDTFDHSVSDTAEVQMSFKPEYIEYNDITTIPGEVYTQMALSGPPNINSSLNNTIANILPPPLDPFGESLNNQFNQNSADSSSRSIAQTNQISSRGIDSLSGTLPSSGDLLNQMNGSALVQSTSSLSGLANVAVEGQSQRVSTVTARTRAIGLNTNAISPDTGLGAVNEDDAQGGNG